MKGVQSGKKNIILLLACSTIFFEAFDTSIVNLALPAIANYFSIALPSAQWIQTLYLTCFGSFLLLGGRLCDHLGCRRIFLIGMLLFCIASFLGAWANHIIVLLIARSFQGIGAALAMPAGITLISNCFEEGTERNKALGIFGSFAAVGFASGLAMGGILTTFFSWRWIFGINVPPLFLIVAIGYFVVPRERHTSKKAISWSVITWLVTTLLLLCYTIHELPRLQKAGIFYFTLTGLSLWALLKYDAKQKHPFLENQLFASHTFIAAQIGAFFLGTCFLSLVFISTLILSIQFTFSNKVIGFLLFPFSLLSALVSKYVLPIFLKKYRVMEVVCLSFTVTIVGTILLVIGIMFTSLPFVLLSIFCISSVVIAIAYPALNILSLMGVQKKHHGTAAGLQSAIYTIGSSMGLSIVGLVFQIHNSTWAFNREVVICFLIVGLMLSAILLFSTVKSMSYDRA